MSPALTTYQVTCAACGEERWPTLPERAERYVCVRCRALTPEQRVKRATARQRGAQTRKSRQRSSGDATGAAE